MSSFRWGVSAQALTCALGAAVLASAPAQAQQRIVVASGTTDTVPKTVGGTDTVTVQANGTLATTTNPAISWSTSSTDLRINNSGIIRSTANGGRAINASGANNVRTVTLVNNVGALIESQDDAFRINVAPTGGTIRIDNFGTIRTTNGGQALDFDAVAGGATVIINNYAGATLGSVGQDGIRPGQGAIVTNAGLIRSDGAANNNYDGIDWQQKSGTVINQTTGVISGLRHGITSDVDVNVTNDGAITGRNGSGIGSDGTGTVVNRGTITGQWDGVATNGDGDGVDIDFIGSVTNSGTIQGLSATGVDPGGRPNSAEGIAMGGGTIVNSGTIFGAGNAILINHDTNVGGVADGATTITNTGTIHATTGRAIQFVGNFSDTITTSGTITGGTAGAIDMGDGNDILNIQSGSVISGTVDGGAGNDRINLGGTGTGSFAGAVNFETLAVNMGNWTLTAPSTFASGIAIAAPATLTGNTTTLSGGITNAGTLVFQQAADGSFVGTLSGTGTLVKTGAGALTIGSQTGFTGPTAVNAGRLVLAGALPSAVTVANGATLGGTGTIAALTVVGGGTVAPGTGVGTIAVTGNFAQASGSVYAAETTAAGLSDRITVGGTATIASGAQLAVTRGTGTYGIGQRYTLLTATGGVSGTYTLVQTASGGTEFRLAQTGTGVFVDVARTAASLPSIAATRNQAAVAPALAALGVGNAAYAGLTLIPSDDAVRAGLDALSGEAHASLRTAMLKDAQGAEDAVRSRLLSPTTGSGIWAQAIGRSGEDDGDFATASAERHGWGGIGGVEIALDGQARVGVAGGYTRTKVGIDARDSFGKVESTHALAYAGGMLGPVALRTGAGYAWTKTDLKRGVVFPGYAARLTSNYDGDVLHGFAEIGLPHAMFGATVEPFAGVEAYRVHTDAFTETGGSAALSGEARKETFTLSTLGIRGQTPIVEGLSARSRIGWQHAFGDASPDARLRFAGASVPFSMSGATLSRDAAVVALDLAWMPVEAITVTSGYSGSIGDRGDDNVFRIALAVGF